MNPDGSHNHALSPGAPAAFTRVPGVPNLEVGMATDPGRDPNKQVNEDSMFARDTPHGFLAVVCDGMGGHVGGKEASHLAIDTIFRVFDATPAGVAPQQILRDALTQANGAVYARGQQSPELKGMGSTCVAILVHPAGTDVAHVGDSRVYLLTQQQVYQVTKDHSLVQRLIDAGMLTPEQAANHPNANQITNAFGQRPDVEVEIRPAAFPQVAGDVFVLCSDGLSDEVGPQDIVQILAPYPPIDQAAKQLIDLANARGGHDNITVILARFPGGGAFAAPSASGHATPTATLAAAPVGQTTTAEMDILQPAAIPASTPIAPPVASVQQPPAPQFTPPPAYAPTPAEMTAAPKRGGGLIVAIVVVILLAAVGVGAALFLRHREENKVEPTPTASSDDDDDKPLPTATKSAIKPVPIPTVSVPEPTPSPRPSQSAPTQPTKSTGTQVPTVKSPGNSPPPESTVKE